MRLGAITPDNVDEYLTSGQRARPHHAKQKKPSEPLSARTMNYSLAVLRMIFREAIDRGEAVTNPAVRVKPLKEERPEGKVQYLTPEHMTRLLDAAEEPFRTMYRVAIDAGLRRGEVLGLKWDDLDLDGQRLHVRRSRIRERVTDGYIVRDGPPKTEGSATVIEDLSPSVVQALLDLPAGDDPERPYVFRNRDGGPFDPDNVDRVRPPRQGGRDSPGLLPRPPAHLRPC